MDPDFDSLFSRFRETPWSADPNASPQERGAGNGNIESQGWLSDGSVTADVIQANAVIAGKISADAVTAGTIAADAVTAREIAADSVTASEIAANTITASEIAANTITSNEIAANTITASDIAANTITASEIAANTITATEIAANAVTASEIAADAVTANEILANTITATEIAANAITASEIAADAVTTTKILAANVTSSRIELTITGKAFGANNGAAGAPGVFFDTDSDTGMYRVGANSIGFSVGGGSALGLDPLANFSDADFEPGSDNTWNLGDNGFRWVDVWAVDGTINTSDGRMKQDIADSPLGLNFVRSLRPRVYRWRDTVDTQARETAKVDRVALAQECQPHENAIQRVRDEQRQGLLSDAEGDELVVKERAAVSKIAERYFGPAKEARRKRRPGKRLHVGLIAQEVKRALDAAGVDVALWKQTPSGDQALAYTELIPVLIRGMQEQQDQIDSLTQRLEGRGG